MSSKSPSPPRSGGPFSPLTPPTPQAAPKGAHDPRRSIARSYDMQYHGTAEERGGNPPLSRFYERGRFGRMFAGLPRYAPDPIQLMELGAVGGPMDARDTGPAPNPANRDHPDGLGAAFTFLGQFVDHDVTFDPTSSLERQVDPEAIANFRTPNLELDSVYGSGPGASPYLYSRKQRDKLLVGRATDAPAGAAGDGTDLSRNVEGTALIGDPRNDENQMVAQLHLAFLRFHNAVVDRIGTNVPAGRSRFEEAQRLVRWHYQHMLVHEFLPHICGQATVDDVLARGRQFYRWRNEPFIPVEFSVAAYRFGHTQVRAGYALSDTFARPLFAGGPPADPPPLPGDLRGGKAIAMAQVIQWHRFLDVPGNAAERQSSKRFDARLSTPLLNLPFAAGTPDDPKSLAQRNLMRGRTFGLPSGQRVARAMRAGLRPGTAVRIDVLEPSELSELQPMGLDRETPLWYYVLREADLRGGGRHLGPMGARIVAEVLIGLLEGDAMSYLAADREWTPFLGSGGEFRLADLLRVAGVAG